MNSEGINPESNCPRCGTPAESFCGECGYVFDNAAIDRKLDRTNLRFVIAFSVLVIVGFGQLAVWGSHALEIRWLQFADTTGMASLQQLERMAVICTELKKRDCVEYAYRRQSELDKKNAVRLAEYQISRRKFQDAIAILRPYVAANKQDLHAYMVLADTLTELEKYDEAARLYEYLVSKSTTLPTEAAKNYVKCLSRARRFQQAENVIYKVRRTYPGTAKFMDGELKILAAMKSATTVR